MANPVEGSKDHPVQLDPWQKIVKVQWDNDVALLEITRDIRTFYSIQSIDPVNPVIDGSIGGNKTIGSDYYLDKDIILTPIRKTTDSIVVAEQISDVWFALQGTGEVPGFSAVIGSPPPNSNFDAAVTNLTAVYGHDPDASGVDVNTVDRIEFNITREDGSTAQYVKGFTTTAGDFQYAIFYNLENIPARFADVVREIVFINFTNTHEKTLKIVNISGAYNNVYDTQFKLSLYSTATKFTISIDDNTITPDKTAKKTFTKSISSSNTGDVVHFNKSGFIAV